MPELADDSNDPKELLEDIETVFEAPKSERASSLYDEMVAARPDFTRETMEATFTFKLHVEDEYDVGLSFSDTATEWSHGDVNVIIVV